MKKVDNFWYLRGLGMLATSVKAEDGSCIKPRIYDHSKRKWVSDKEGYLYKCLDGSAPSFIAEPVTTNSEVHKLEQIDWIALRFAEDAYEGMVDKFGLPAIEHPRFVAALVDTPLEKAAAYLHGIISDTDVTYEAINRAFGSEIARLVNLLTCFEGEDYINDYMWCIADDETATEVKFADLFHEIYMEYAHPETKDQTLIDKLEGGYLFLNNYKLSDEEMYNIINNIDNPDAED